MALQLDSVKIGSPAAKEPAKFQNDWISQNPNLTASMLHEILQQVNRGPCFPCSTIVVTTSGNRKITYFDTLIKEKLLCRTAVLLLQMSIPCLSWTRISSHSAYPCPGTYCCDLISRYTVDYKLRFDFRQIFQVITQVLNSFVEQGYFSKWPTLVFATEEMLLLCIHCIY